MKKQIKKLNLSKKTITNLGVVEMNKMGGAKRTFGCDPTDYCTHHRCPTMHGQTCNTHC